MTVTLAASTPAVAQNWGRSWKAEQGPKPPLGMWGGRKRTVVNTRVECCPWVLPDSPFLHQSLRVAAVHGKVHGRGGGGGRGIVMTVMKMKEKIR